MASACSRSPIQVWASRSRSCLAYSSAFTGVEGSQGRTHEGSGIGLALVQLHGGSSEMESQLDHGSTFRVRVPRGVEHLPAERLRAPSPLPWSAGNAEAFVQDAVHWRPQAEPAAPRERSSIESDAPALHRPFAATFGARVLVADDNAGAHLSEVLAPFYQVELAAAADQALAAIRRERPDLLLADVMMPRIDGFNLVRTLRASAQLSDIPVILLSARADLESRTEGMDTGADD